MIHLKSRYIQATREAWRALEGSGAESLEQAGFETIGETGIAGRRYNCGPGGSYFIAEKSGLTEPTEARSGAGVAAAATTVPVTVRVSGASAPE